MQREKSLRSVVWALCLFILAAVFIAAPSSLWAAPLVKKPFVIAEANEYRVIDPQKTGGEFGAAFYTYAFQGLVGPSGLDWHLVGDVAASWQNLDPLHWKFKIRKGVKFHNGQPLTAEDIRFSMLRQMGRINDKFQASTVGTWNRLIEEVEAPDAETIVFKTHEPDASFMSTIRFLFIVPKALIEKVGDDAFGQEPVGTGPYMISEHKVGESLTLKAFRGFFRTRYEPGVRGPASVETVVLRSIPQEQTRVAGMQTGEVDAAVVRPDTAAGLKNNPAIGLYYVHRNAPTFIMFNWGPPPKQAEGAPAAPQKNPYEDVRVRRALNYALDVPALIKNFGTGKEDRTTLVGRGGIGYNPKVPFYKYDPEKAKKLLAEAGYPNGFSTRIYLSTDTPPAAEAIIQSFMDIGINIDRVQTTSPVVQRNIIKKTLDGMVFWGAGFGGPDPAATWLQNCVSSKGNWAVHGINDEVEALVEKQAVEFDQARRAKIIDQIVQILWRDAWFIPLWEPVYIHAVRSDWKYQSMPAWATINVFSLGRK